MDRKAFLKQLWQRLFKPLLFLIVLYYTGAFLISALFLDTSPERMFSVLILAITVLFLLTYAIGSLLNTIIEKIYSGLSDKTKNALCILKKIADFIVVLLLGALMYRLWTQNAIWILIVLSILLISRIYSMITEQNHSTDSSKM